NGSWHSALVRRASRLEHFASFDNPGTCLVRIGLLVGFVPTLGQLFVWEWGKGEKFPHLGIF
ncbi:MAG: hypothetical protein OJI67_24780, partial [Prosthecobacter sp.]|nr:hypothetical protein [Prosthecobacter sp.]